MLLLCPCITQGPDKKTAVTPGVSNREDLIYGIVIQEMKELENEMGHEISNREKLVPALGMETARI